MTTELSPCPFCGGPVSMRPYKNNGFVIQCRSCAVKREQRVLRQSVEWLETRMIEDWNRRAALAATPAPAVQAPAVVKPGWISVDERDLRGLLASTLLCWHRLTKAETQNVLQVFESIAQPLQPASVSKPEFDDWLDRVTKHQDSQMPTPWQIWQAAMKTAHAHPLPPKAHYDQY